LLYTSAFVDLKIVFAFILLLKEVAADESREAEDDLNTGNSNFGHPPFRLTPNFSMSKGEIVLVFLHYTSAFVDLKIVFSFILLLKEVATDESRETEDDPNTGNSIYGHPPFRLTPEFPPVEGGNSTGYGV